MHATLQPKILIRILPKWRPSIFYILIIYLLKTNKFLPRNLCKWTFKRNNLFSPQGTPWYKTYRTFIILCNTVSQRSWNVLGFVLFWFFLPFKDHTLHFITENYPTAICFHNNNNQKDKWKQSKNENHPSIFARQQLAPTATAISAAPLTAAWEQPNQCTAKEMCYRNRARR